MAEAVVDADTDLAHSPLVSVSFQRDEQRKLKFLEGEPKALGITQICLILFHGSCVVAFIGCGLNERGIMDLLNLIAAVFILIGGSLAIAAQNLHLPTLRACLGMEILSSMACIVTLFISLIRLVGDYYCYSGDGDQDCQRLHNAHLHLSAELILIHVALFAISVTLAVYASKVINCCCPAPKVPVVMILAPQAPQAPQ